MCSAPCEPIVKFFSSNIRGLNNAKKRKTFLTSLKKAKHDIVFLQETYSNKDSCEEWQNEWGGRALFAHGSNHSRGVAILFRPGFSFELVKETIDQFGRYIICQIEVNEIILDLVNLYSPNILTEQTKFFKHLDTTFQKLNLTHGSNMIVAGDWNVVLNPVLDKRGGIIDARSTVRNFVKTKFEEYELCDIWRDRNPAKIKFTWRQKQPHVQCRLDYFAISYNLREYVDNAIIEPAIYSDHSPVTLKFKFHSVQRGNGLWKFNNSLLENEAYVTEMTQCLETWINKYSQIENKQLLWELMKFEIRNYTIDFSKKLARKNRETEQNLVDRAAQLEDTVALLPDSDVTWLEYENLKSEIRKLAENKVRGQIVRSRVQWAEDNESQSSVFIDIEKSNRTKKNINKLKINGQETTNAKDIMGHIVEFYTNLLQSKEAPDITLDTYFQEVANKVPKLSEADKNTCDEILTITEVEAALKLMKPNKTPGNDGISVEFYKHFWHIIKHTVFDSFNHSLENGILSNSQRQGVISLSEKRDRDRLSIGNWRPITLLNNDYKLLTKSIAERLKRVMPSIIHPNQTGFIKDRNIAENLRILFDILDDVMKRKLGGMLMTLDIEKAFDTLHWNFMIKSLQTFNFGSNFINMVQIFYNNISSCVLNNNLTSKYISIHRGVRQGDPLSSLLFVIAIEILNVKIRDDRNIHGIMFSNEELKVLNYADDTTLKL